MPEGLDLHVLQLWSRSGSEPGLKVVTARRIRIPTLLHINIQAPGGLGGRTPYPSTYTPRVPQLLPCDPPEG